MVSGLRRRLGWWHLPLWLALAVGLMHALLLVMAWLFGESESTRGFSVRGFAATWLIAAAVFGMVEWWSVRRQGRKTDERQRRYPADMPRWLTIAEFTGNVVSIATVFSAGTAALYGEIALVWADVLIGIGFLPMGIIGAFMTVRYESGPQHNG
jgi:hypothetical protein